jgi:hypothetical protein
MTRRQAEQVARGLRAAGWPIVSIEMDRDGRWRAVAEDPQPREGWLTRRLATEHPASLASVSGRLN